MIKNHILYTEFSNWEFNVSKAIGSFIWNEKGERLIDFTSGWNVTNLGWNNPEINEAMIQQIKKSTYVPMWTADPIQEALAEELISSLPEELKIIGRATGGTEANEEAIKTARAFTKREKIIGFKDTYHGQSYATLSIGYLPEYIKNMGIGPMVDGFIQMDYPSTYRTNLSEEELLSEFSTKLEKLLQENNVAAVVSEAGIITGWGSTYVAPHGFIKIVRELTKKYGTLLILDEVGTGFSRCGKLFGMEIENIVPDIVTFAKGFSNGAVAIGGLVTTEEIAKETFKKSNLVSTFGWTPVACAAALKTLQIHKRDKIWLKAKEDGDFMINFLKNELKNNDFVGDIRGIGLEIGVDFVKNKKTKEKNTSLADKIVVECRNNGLHVIFDEESNIQLMPPLVIERSVLKQGLEIFCNTINKISTASH
jgi:4-aminobutyrate aminotransferase-like enzyme